MRETCSLLHACMQVGEPEVEELFAPCGKILALKLGRDDSGRSRVSGGMWVALVGGVGWDAR